METIYFIIAILHIAYSVFSPALAIFLYGDGYVVYTENIPIWYKLSIIVSFLISNFWFELWAHTYTKNKSEVGDNMGE